MKLIYKILCSLLLCGSINTAKAQCWQSISGGYYHSLAIKQNGTLWAWGFNAYGQLGDGGNNDKNTPTQIGTATNWQSISVARNNIDINSLTTQTAFQRFAIGVEIKN
jgi:alpha-tubulin suppressor-like RCC1 family protein